MQTEGGTFKLGQATGWGSPFPMQFPHEQQQENGDIGGREGPQGTEACRGV